MGFWLRWPLIGRIDRARSIVQPAGASPPRSVKGARSAHASLPAMVQVLTPSSIWGQLVSTAELPVEAAGRRWCRRPLARASGRAERPRTALCYHPSAAAPLHAGQPVLPVQRPVRRPAGRPHLPVPGLHVSCPARWPGLCAVLLGGGDCGMPPPSTYQPPHPHVLQMAAGSGAGGLSLLALD